MLATSGTKSFVIFLYEDLQWGGGEAVAGINAGDGINFITIPGSLSQDILSITETSNVGNPGVWMFEVSTGTYIMLSNSMVVLFSRVPPKVMDANKIATIKLAHLKTIIMR